MFSKKFQDMLKKKLGKEFSSRTRSSPQAPQETTYSVSNPPKEKKPEFACVMRGEPCVAIFGEDKLDVRIKFVSGRDEVFDYYEIVSEKIDKSTGYLVLKFDLGKEGDSRSGVAKIEKMKTIEEYVYVKKHIKLFRKELTKAKFRRDKIEEERIIRWKKEHDDQNKRGEKVFSYNVNEQPWSKRLNRVIPNFSSFMPREKKEYGRRGSSLNGSFPLYFETFGDAEWESDKRGTKCDELLIVDITQAESGAPYSSFFRDVKSNRMNRMGVGGKFNHVDFPTGFDPFEEETKKIEEELTKSEITDLKNITYQKAYGIAMKAFTVYNVHSFLDKDKEYEKNQERIAFAKEALSINEYCSAAFNVLGIFASKSYQEAIGYFKKSIQVCPKEKINFDNIVHEGLIHGKPTMRSFYRSHIGLARCFKKLGKFKESYKYYMKLERLQKKHLTFSTYVNFRRCVPESMIRLGKFQEALLYMEKHSDIGQYHSVRAAWLWDRILTSLNLRRSLPKIPNFFINLRKTPQTSESWLCYRFTEACAEFSRVMRYLDGDLELPKLRIPTNVPHHNDVRAAYSPCVSMAVYASDTFDVWEKNTSILQFCVLGVDAIQMMMVLNYFELSNSFPLPPEEVRLMDGCELFLQRACREFVNSSGKTQMLRRNDPESFLFLLKRLGIKITRHPFVQTESQVFDLMKLLIETAEYTSIKIFETLMNFEGFDVEKTKVCVYLCSKIKENFNKEKRSKKLLRKLVLISSIVYVRKEKPKLKRLIESISSQIQKRRRKCDNCGVWGIMKRCTGCGNVYYCDRKCQIISWKSHKLHCKKVTKMKQKI